MKNVVLGSITAGMMLAAGLAHADINIATAGPQSELGHAGGRNQRSPAHFPGKVGGTARHGAH